MSDDLVDFIRAQLDEDERIAAPLVDRSWTWLPDEVIADMAEHVPRHDPDRVMREVEAKRRVVDLCQLVGPDMLFIGSAFPPGDEREFAAQVLALLALPYADCPGYREEWRP